MKVSSNGRVWEKGKGCSGIYVMIKMQHKYSLSDSIKTLTHIHLLRKQTLNWLNGWVFVYKLSGCGFESRCSHFNFRYRVDIQAIIECGVILKRVRDMIRIYIQINIAVSRMIWKTTWKIGAKDFCNF